MSRENRVHQAIQSLPPDLASINLRHFSFRQPKGIKEVAKVCTGIHGLKITYNVFESGYDFNLDDSLIDLLEFRGKPSVTLEINCINMLFVIQLIRLPDYGHMIEEISLTEAEFFHPLTLNNFAKSCKNLRKLVIINPAVIGDGMFVGEVPPLEALPFRSLENLYYEGDLSRPVASFLFKHTQNLKQLYLRVSNQFKSEYLKILIGGRSKRHLSKITLIIQSAEDDFVEQLDLWIEKLASVREFRLMGSGVDVAQLQDLHKKIRRKNWDLKFEFFMKGQRGNSSNLG